METITIQIPSEKKQKYIEAAEKAGKTLEQYIIDKIEGVPRGYTLKDKKIVVHELEAEEIKKMVDSITQEPIISKEEFEAVQTKLNSK